MYQTKIFGGYGKVSSPIEGAWGHYSLGILHEKEEAATPFMILSNGVIARNQSADARFSGNLGTVTIPAVPILQGIELTDLKAATNNFMKTTKDQIAYFLDKKNDPVKSLITDTHRYMNISFESSGEAPGMQNLKQEDFFAQTWPRLQQKGIVGFKDLYYRYFIARKPYLIEICNDIQSEITDIVRTVRGAPRLMKVGYGLCEKTEDGLKLQRRPSRYTRFNVNTARLDITNDPYMNTPLRMQSAYVWLLAMQMKNMMTYSFADGKGKGIINFEDADYCALANSLLLQMSGSGDIKIEKTYTATDIVEQMLHMVGYNIAESYPFLPQTDEAWEEMFEFWLIASLVAARAKATTLMGEINLHSARNGIRAPYDFERYTKANLPNFGSLGQPYYFMARNSLGNDFPVPCGMNYDDLDAEFFPIWKKTGAEELPNVYDILMQKEPIKFGSADVTRGEVVGTPLDPLTDDVYLKLIIHPDSRIQDVEYSMNSVRIFRMPVFTVMGSVEGMPEALRIQAYLINLFANGKQNLKEGYFMNPGLGVFNIMKVKTFLNSLGQEIVVKSDTNSTGIQTSSPNTVIPDKSPLVQQPTAARTTSDGPLAVNEKAGLIGETVSDKAAITAETGK